MATKKSTAVAVLERPRKKALTKKAAAEDTKLLKNRSKALAAGIDVTQFENDAASKREPTKKDLEAVGENAKALRDLYKRQAKGQVVMKEIQDAIDNIELKVLPTLLEAAGLIEATLPDGSQVLVVKEFYPNIKKEDEQKAFAWLRKHDFDAIIKTEVKSVFGKGEDAKALALMKLLQQKKVAFVSKEAIHALTLKAFVKEQLADGNTLPPTIGVHTISRAQLKAPK